MRIYFYINDFTSATQSGILSLETEGNLSRMSDPKLLFVLVSQTNLSILTRAPRFMAHEEVWDKGSLDGWIYAHRWTLSLPDLVLSPHCGSKWTPSPVSPNSDQCSHNKYQPKGEFSFPNTSSSQWTLASIQGISQPLNEAPGNEMIESLCCILFSFPKNRCALYQMPLYHLKSSY